MNLHLRQWSSIAAASTAASTAKEAAATEHHALLCLHGMESHSAWFAPLAEQLVKITENTTRRIAAKNQTDYQLDVLAYDRCGWGHSPGTRGRLQKASDAVHELQQVISRLPSHYTHIHLLGMSWGGLLAAYSLPLLTSRIDSLTLLAPAIFPKRSINWHARCRVALGLLTRFPFDVHLPIYIEDFSSDPTVQRYIHQDLARIQTVSPGFCWATRTMQRYVHQLSSPKSQTHPWPRTLLLLAQEDRLINNSATRAWAQATFSAALRIVDINHTQHAIALNQALPTADLVSQHLRAR